MSPLEIVTIPNGVFEENCYLVSERGGSEGVLIDPGEAAEEFLAEAAARGVRIGAIWLTHAHIDHILGVGAVQRATGAPIHLHPDDRKIYDDLVGQGALFGFEVEPAPPPDHPLEHGQVLSVGAHRFEVRHAPGHSPGHVCFVSPGVVFGGDLLFQGSIGRTDLMGGDTELLLESIHEQLLQLPDDTVIYPGHGPATTIGRERVSNPFLNGVALPRRS